jgi:L-ascorbate metabolism protein UlaG (beta-lactamase superfamily)
VAEAELDKNIPIVTTHQAAEELDKRGFTNLRPLEKWESIGFEQGDSRLIITATPGRHGPAGLSVALPDVMGSILEFQSPRPTPRVYISGDTLMFDEIDQISQRFPDIDYGLLHLGGTRVLGVTVTLDGEEGVRLMQAVNPREAVAIHYDDYDVFKSSVQEFVNAAHAAGWAGRVQVPERGNVIELLRRA